MKDPEAGAAEVVAGVLTEFELAGPTWVAGDASGKIEAVVRQQSPVLSWQRAGAKATAWPPDERANAAVIRLPKGRDAYRMVLHAIAARTAPGAPLLVVGRNDEGVRSAGKPLAEVVEEPRTLDARRHCRVWCGTVRGDVVFRGSLDKWAQTAHAKLPRTLLPEGALSWVSFPGLFAHGKLDPATRLLLEVLAPSADDARVLDFGCGAGVIAASLGRSQPGLELHALDVDPLALEATKRNAPTAKLHLGDGLAALPAELRFDRIVSNPPIHTGHTQHHDIVRLLCRDAAGRLRSGGDLWLVTQRTVPVPRMLGDRARVDEVAANPSFTVWRASGFRAAD